MPVADGAAWFQEPIDVANAIWAGNVFTCPDPAIRLTLVADGQDPGRQPFLEVHNPGKVATVADVSSPAGTPLFGGTVLHVTVPAGSSVQVVLAPVAGP